MHWFLDPIRNHYFDFEGRVTRQAFWMYVLYYVIIDIVVGIIGQIIHVSVLSSLLGLALLLPTLGIGARRLHDTGLSGWWQLIGIIPIVGWIVVIVLMAREGQKNENAYGPAPQTAPQQTGAASSGTENSPNVGVDSDTATGSQT